MMTVNELIEVLKRYDGDMPVVAAKFEMGYDEIDEHRVVELVLDVNGDAGDACGPHELRANVDATGKTVRKAVVLGVVEPSLTEAERARRVHVVRLV